MTDLYQMVIPCIHFMYSSYHSIQINFFQCTNFDYNKKLFVSAIHQTVYHSFTSNEQDRLIIAVRNRTTQLKIPRTWTRALAAGEIVASKQIKTFYRLNSMNDNDMDDNDMNDNDMNDNTMNDNDINDNDMNNNDMNDNAMNDNNMDDNDMN
ncbi:hypothetical protein LOAG_11659 [Loa loa]|uniref:Uncharacterized protein n=1 Tax=Loa loa TaxID=7209 RepID=A0A1S0TML6_LOALO|nr:hypothetical protein LOAG_11659 [Loa loa]EFO16843.1 hypothetical protein LOAG_11659 [Loa loa]